MNVADMATIHSFKNICDVNGLGRRGASEIVFTSEPGFFIPFRFTSRKFPILID